MKQETQSSLPAASRSTFETGRMAKQASGAALFTSSGDNVILATAVAAPDPREGIDFFPLTVEYREFTYAGGRIPGGFIKREGRPSREGNPDQPPDRPPDPSPVPGGLPQRDPGGSVRLLGRQGERSRRAGHQRRKLRAGTKRHSFHGPVGAVRVGLSTARFVNPTYAERAVSTAQHHGRRHQGRHRDGRVGCERSQRRGWWWSHRVCTRPRSRRSARPSKTWSRAGKTKRKCLVAAED